MTVEDLINQLDGAGLVITDEDDIRAELAKLGIDPKTEIPTK